MKRSGKDYNRIVIKIGSSLFASQDKGIGAAVLDDIVDQVCRLINEGKEIIIVSSGAIAMGMRMLGLKSRPKELSYLQATAAIGQNILMDTYSNAFGEKKFTCAQVLLTWEDFSDRKRYLNAKNTLLTLLKLKSIPVINENDTVSTDEIKFGDNDRLSALVASLVGADLLIILSDVDGLIDKSRKTVIKVVDEITPAIKSLACPTQRKTSVGGMVSKIEAAKIAVDSGIPCVIANGRTKNIVVQVTQAPDSVGTLFCPKRECLAAKKRWIAFGTKAKGKIVIDEGAKNALENKKSLLSVGVVACEGNFEAGDIVRVVVVDKDSYEFARGKAGISSRQLEKVKGIRSDKEVIHRDNIVILSEDITYGAKRT